MATLVFWRDFCFDFDIYNIGVRIHFNLLYLPLSLRESAALEHRLPRATGLAAWARFKPAARTALNEMAADMQDH